MFESESNWFSNNCKFVDCVEIEKTQFPFQNAITRCVSCGNLSTNPSSDHFFYAENMILCESCYLDYNLMTNN